MDKFLVKNKEQICRSCLEKSNDLQSIFKLNTFIEDTNIKLSTLLIYCTNIEVNEDDNFPSRICKKCVNKVVDAFKFKQQFIRASIILKQKFEFSFEKNVSSDLNFEHVNIKPEIDELKYELKNADIDDFENHLENIFQQESSNSTLSGNHSATDNYFKVLSNRYTSENSLPSQKTSKTVKRKNKKNKPEEIAYFTCEICSKIMKNSSLKKHMTLHSDLKPFQCKECGESFKTRYSRDGHLTTHFPNLHTCKFCEKIFKQARTLKDHIRMHNGEQISKPFLCGICGMELSRSYSLKKHMLIHTNEKPHSCDICGKHFRNLSTLIVHKQRHQGLKPYECTECDLRFTEKTHLKRHFLVHTGEKPYPCDICDKRFNRRSNLTVHRRTHTGEKIHCCKICNEGFTQNSYLKAHMAVHS